MPSTESCGDMPADAVVVCADEQAVAGFATRLAAALPPRAMLAIEGDLGAGKTTFVKHLAAAIGIDPSGVTSPTFTLAHLHEVAPADGAAGDESARSDHASPTRLVHIDAYRLSGLDDLATIGWEEFVAGEGWLAVEWPERVAAALPADRLTIRIEITGMDSRTLHLQATSPALRQAAQAAAA